VKRFTETGKWEDPWFMDLPGKYKLFWQYICDRCDCAGVWDTNMRLAVTQIGEPLELTEILRVFEKRIFQLGNGKLWIQGFIKFQYGAQLNLTNTAHVGVLRRLEINQISTPLPIAPAKGLQRGFKAPKDKDKDKDKDKKGVPKGKTSSAVAEQIYAAYPRKVGKPAALNAIRKQLVGGHCSAEFLLERTKTYALTQTPGDRFTPHPATWFNQERFNDDPSTWTVTDKKRERPSRQDEAEEWYNKKYGTTPTT